MMTEDLNNLFEPHCKDDDSGTRKTNNVAISG